MALSAQRSLGLRGLRPPTHPDGLGPTLAGTLPSTDKPSFSGVATTLYAVAKIKKNAEEASKAVGVQVPLGRPYSPHGRVELILEANPNGAHYHGALEPRALSPVKKQSAATFRSNKSFHESVRVMVASSEARANALRPRMNTRLGSRFPREMIKESAKRVTSCAAGKDSAHHLSGTVSEPLLIATVQPPPVASSKESSAEEEPPLPSVSKWIRPEPAPWTPAASAAEAVPTFDRDEVSGSSRRRQRPPSAALTVGSRASGGDLLPAAFPEPASPKGRRTSRSVEQMLKDIEAQEEAQGERRPDG